MFIWIFLINLLLASETDQFTARLYPLEDSTEVINHEVNRRLDLVEIEMQEHGCDVRKLYKKVGKHLRRRLYGQIEGWMTDSDLGIPQIHIPLDESIYQDLNFFENIPAHIYRIGMGSTFLINQEYVGSDKIGHFFDEGWTLFSIYKETDSLELALDYSDESEGGIFGKITTGVESFADKVANFNGMRFWSSLVGEGYPLKKTIYFSCENKHLVRVKDFDFAEYVDGGWDESINCSEYRSVKFMQTVTHRIKLLGMSCPIQAEKCSKLNSKYGEFSKRLIHPSCLALN